MASEIAIAYTNLRVDEASLEVLHRTIKSVFRKRTSIKQIIPFACAPFTCPNPLIEPLNVWSKGLANLLGCRHISGHI